MGFSKEIIHPKLEIPAIFTDAASSHFKPYLFFFCGRHQKRNLNVIHVTSGLNYKFLKAYDSFEKTNISEYSHKIVSFTVP